MMYRRETLNVKRATSFVERVVLRSLDSSRFTLYERRSPLQAGC